ncbi:MAG: cytochrome c biogenesis protein CcdA, partial [Thermomicrobiales bacterium]
MTRRLPVLALVSAAAMMILLVGIARAAERPAYEATYLDGSGAFSLESLRGDVVLLNVWATWCEPCKREIPALAGIASDYEAADLHLIGVSIDRTQSDEQIATVGRDLGATYPLARDAQNEFASVFHTTGVPVTVLIDRSGQVVRQWPGDIENHLPELRAAIDTALASSGTVDSSALPKLSSVGFAAAFGAGMLSVLSPCVLPLLPTYAAYITGVSVDEMMAQRGDEQRRRRSTTLRNGLLFVLGFSLVFIALGASASAFGSWLIDWRVWFARVGGILLLGMGLH